MAERRVPIGERPQTVPGGRTRNNYVTQVVANPADPGSLPAPSMSELAGLLDGLATFDKALGSHIDQGIREEQAAGRRARATGQAQPDDASEDFARGYMAMDMSVKGDQDGAAMVQSYESSFDPDKDNFDDWLAKQYGERAYGLDGPFREHYDTTFIKHVEKVRTAHAQAEGARVREKVESNALYVLDKAIGEVIETGGTLTRAGAAPTYMAADSVDGLVERGNINLSARPRVRNADGSVSTVRSMSVNFDGAEVLIPTVSEDGRVVSDDEAIALYRKTGRHLGKFTSPSAADAYAELLHKQQETQRGPLERLSEQVRKLGVSGDRFDELLFSAVKKYGDEGRPSVYQALKENRPDGSPGMYFSPEWKAKIDAAEEAATRAYVSGRKAVEEGMRKERDQRQEEAVGKVLQIEDPKEAREAFDALLRDGLITNATDIDKYQRMLESRIKREATPEQQEAESMLLMRIYRGEAGTMDIIRAAGEGQISTAGRKSLLSEWYRVKNDQRQAAAQSGSSLNRRFNSPLVRQGEQIINTMMALSKSLLEAPPEVQAAATANRVAAETAYTLAIARGEVPEGGEIDFANKLVKQYSTPQTPSPQAPKAPPKPFAQLSKDAEQMTSKQLEDYLRQHSVPIKP